MTIDKKIDMVSFSLNMWRKGNPVYTRNGLPVTELTYFRSATQKKRLVGVVDGQICTWCDDGSFHSELVADDLDLFHPDVRHIPISVNQ